MVYYNAIPQDTDDPSDSQAQILTNFGTLNTVFGNDHVNYTTTPAQGLQGQHLYVTFNNVTTNPSLTYPTGRLYTKTFGSGTAYPELYFNAPTSAATQFYPLVPTIKCCGTFTNTGSSGNQPLTTINTLTVNNPSVSAAAAGSQVTFTVTFATPLPYDTYYPFVNSTGITSSLLFNAFNILTTGFSFIGTNLGSPQQVTYRFFVF